MRVLVYKRTHNGDPDELGQFGIHDCMGSVRAREYQTVIGVGGIGREPTRIGISRKMNWIGIGPHKFGRPDRPLVAFDRFMYFAEIGPLLDQYAPLLAAHLYDRGARVMMFIHR